MKSTYAYLFAVYATVMMVSVEAMTEVYFSPDDKPERKLVEIINQTKNSIRAAVYHVTNKKICDALKEARARGVKVELILDRCSIGKSSKLVDSLAQAGITVHIFHPMTLGNGYMPLMHNKYGLFDMGENKKLLWTGSFNWTNAANNLNQENIVLTDDKGVYAKFDEHFGKLRKRSGEQNYVAKSVVGGPRKAMERDYRASLLQLLPSHLRIIVRP
jgi:phosphatidylserine/phosphatidylglycerophosphate/cardiolipin synthase-like enzyme